MPMTQISINYAIVLYQLGVSKEDIRYSKELFEEQMRFTKVLTIGCDTAWKYVVIDRLFPESIAHFSRYCAEIRVFHSLMKFSRHTAIMQTNRKMFCVQSCSMWKNHRKSRLRDWQLICQSVFHKNKVVLNISMNRNCSQVLWLKQAASGLMKA